MSIVTVWRENDAVILSSDSRSTEIDGSGVSDVETKIFELGVGIFTGHVGTTCASQFQLEQGRKIAADTSDILRIARELGRASVPFLTMLLEKLRTNHDEVSRRKVCGADMLQAFSLVGLSAGRRGYVTQTFWAQDGTVKYFTESYFGDERKLVAHSGVPAEVMNKISVELCNDPKTWSDPMDEVSMRFLETAKQTCNYIGGLWQVLRLDNSGVHWVSLPEWARPEGGKSESLRILHGANSVAIAAGGVTIVGGVLTSPTINGGSLTISNSAMALAINSTVCIKLTTVYNSDVIQITDLGFNTHNSANTAEATMVMYHGTTEEGQLRLSGSGTGTTTLTIRPATRTSASAGSASALPVYPSGYLRWTTGAGTVIKVPYYDD